MCGAYVWYWGKKAQTLLAALNTLLCGALCVAIFYTILCRVAGYWRLVYLQLFNILYIGGGYTLVLL
jgi:hypothetical protein